MNRGIKILHRKTFAALIALLLSALTAHAQTVGGKVVAWGDNSQGQTNVPASMTNALSVAAGGYHSLALLPSGQVAAWGYGLYGQTNVPAILTNAVAIAAGREHSLALTSDGTISVWGYSTYGIATVPAAATNVAAIAAGWYHNLALRSNGTVVAWGAGTYQGPSPNFGQSIVPLNLTGVVAVAAGGYHSLALRTDGTVVAWGQNTTGQTNVPVGLSNVTAIAAGQSHSIALRGDGTLLAWGDNSSGQTNIPVGLSNVVAISAGAAHNMALKNDGTLLVWGLNGNGQTNKPAGFTNFAAISAGAYFSLGLVNVGPVTFLSPPYSQTLYKGGSATFTTPFLGAAPTSCQWLQNGMKVVSGTNASLTITNAQLTDAGNYQLVVSNSYGAVTSSVAVLIVKDTAPFFTVQPTNLWVLQSSNTTLTANVGGIPPFNFQWLFNGANLSGATNTTLIVTNAQPTNQGNYSLVASNAYGTTTSSNSFLTVVDVPTALGPTNLVWQNASKPPWFPETSNTLDGFAAEAGPMAVDTFANLQTSVTGPGTLSFSWEAMGGAQLTFWDAGQKALWSNPWWNSLTFYLTPGLHNLIWEAFDEFGSRGTTAFLDQMTFTPGATAAFITTQPASQTNAAGNNMTFTVGVAGTPPLSYQWYFNGSTIPGATTTSLTLTNIQTNNIGSYNLLATNSYGMAISSNAMLGVIFSAPTLTSQPASLLALVGGPATFNGSAIGSNPINYQWLFNGSPIFGATNPSLTINSVQSGNGGNYALSASNAINSVVSSNAILTTYAIADLAAALDNPGINWNTTNVYWFPETNVTHDGVSAAQSGVISGGQQSTLQGVTSGPATVTYWWKVSCDSFWDSLAFALNGTIQNSIAGSVDWQQATNYIGAGSQTLQWNLYPVHGAFAGGTAWVDQVQVTPGGTAPIITVNPANVANNAGNNVSFSVSATGTPPLFYQWQFGGTNLPGTTNSTLTLNNIQVGNAGNYSVTVSNAFGSTASLNATLTVNPSAPVITLQPATQSAAVNGSVTFTSTAKGSSPLIYQWQFDGTPIPGATTTTLLLTGLQATNAGNYVVIVTNNYGAVTSSIASLEVNPTAVLEFWPLGVSPAYSTPFGLSNVVAIAAGDAHTVALRNDGTVTVWGLNTYGQTNMPGGLSNAVAISAGSYHTAALKTDGTVVVWGDNSYGQTAVPAGVSNIVAIAAGANDTFALRNDGIVIGWGNNGNGQTNVPMGLSNVVALASAAEYGFAVKLDGTVAQWGNYLPFYDYSYGGVRSLTVAVGLSNVVAVGAGEFSSWSLQSDGTVTGWGFDGPGGFPGIAAISAAGDSDSRYDYVLVLKNDGTVAVGGAALPGYTPNIPVSPSNVVTIAAATGHAAVLVNDGTPRVAQPLLNRIVYTSSTVVFSAGIVGVAPLSYQWQYNGANLVGATNVFLVLTNVPFSAAGNYTCMASNALGTATNLNTTLSVLRSAPQFSGAASLPNNGFALQVNQLSGHGAVIILASTNLVDWIPVFTNLPVTGSIQFTDPGATNQPARFYRAIEQ